MQETVILTNSLGVVGFNTTFKGLNFFSVQESLDILKVKRE